MPSKSATLLKPKFDSYSYSYNRTIVPFPESAPEKSKPPVSNFNFVDCSHVFTPVKEKTLDEKKQEFINKFLQAERYLVVSFYTGGASHRKGALDAIYKGFNPMAQPVNA